MSNITTTKFKSHEEWLDLRREGIGGSDASIIVGLNKYSSPYMLWLDKLGKTEPKETNEAMRQGTDLEAYVAERFKEETGKRVRRRNCIIKNSEYPFALANVDRWIIGENAGLECKTINSNLWNKYGDDEFPEYYYIQCLHYMAVTGADKYYLAILVLGKDFKVFEFERDQEAIDGLMSLEEEFWGYVKKETPPPVDGTIPTDEALQINYKNQVDKTITLFGMNEVAEELYLLKQDKKNLEQKIKLLEQQIKNEMGENARAETDCFKFSLLKRKQPSFKYKQFMEDHPEIDFSKYYKEKEVRAFRMNLIKD